MRAGYVAPAVWLVTGVAKGAVASVGPQYGRAAGMSVGFATSIAATWVDSHVAPAPRVCLGEGTYREYDYLDVEIPEGGRVAVAGERFTIDAEEHDPLSTHEEPAASSTVHAIARVVKHPRGDGYTYWIAGLNDGEESERAHMWLPYGRLYLAH